MKKILPLLLIAVLVGAFVGYKMYNKPHQNIEKTASDIKVTATQLFEEYEANEANSNKKYLDKIVEVTGTVQEVKKNDDGTVSINLEGGMMFGVRCNLDPLTKHKRTDFKPNEKITLKGKCTGMLMDVVLERCVEVK